MDNNQKIIFIFEEIFFYCKVKKKIKKFVKFNLTNMNIYSDDEDYQDYDNSDDIYCEDDYFDQNRGANVLLE